MNATLPPLPAPWYWKRVGASWRACSHGGGIEVCADLLSADGIEICVSAGSHAAYAPYSVVAAVALVADVERTKAKDARNREDPAQLQLDRAFEADLVPCSCSSRTQPCDPDPECGDCRGSGIDVAFAVEVVLAYVPWRCACAWEEIDIDPEPTCWKCDGSGMREWGL